MSSWSYERGRDPAGLWQRSLYRPITAVERRVLREGLQTLGDSYYHLPGRALLYLTEDVEIRVGYGSPGDLPQTLSDAWWMMTLSPLLPLPILQRLCVYLSTTISTSPPDLEIVQAILAGGTEAARVSTQCQILLLLPPPYRPTVLDGLRRLAAVGGWEATEAGRLCRWIEWLEKAEGSG